MRFVRRLLKALLPVIAPILTLSLASFYFAFDLSSETNKFRFRSEAVALQPGISSLMVDDPPFLTEGNQILMPAEQVVSQAWGKAMVKFMYYVRGNAFDDGRLSIDDVRLYRVEIYDRRFINPIQLVIEVPNTIESEYADLWDMPLWRRRLGDYLDYLHRVTFTQRRIARSNHTLPSIPTSCSAVSF